MPYTTEWGKELAKLSDDNFDFLKSNEIKKFIALDGRVERIEQASDLMKSMIAAYVPSSVLGESPGRISFNSMLCIYQVSLYIESLKGNPVNRVLELGAGFGNFSRVFRQYIDVRQYEIYDIPVMSRFARKFLKAHYLERSTLIFDSATDIDLAHITKYDVFISNICMSEMPHPWRQEIIEKVWPNCKAVFIIDGDSNDITYDMWLASCLKRYFDIVQIIPFKSVWKGQSVYVGRKKLEDNGCFIRSDR
jgi:putative sugar O-methyltransferase